MNVVILHCHFERGGVTQVVENHVAGIIDAEENATIWLGSGPRQSGLSPSTRDATRQFVVDDFDYDPPGLPAGSARHRAEAIGRRLTVRLREAGCRPEDTVIHWHNHSLGKNTAAPEVIRRLADDGWRLLLQIHDFAEDQRPENYAALITASGAADRMSLERYLYPDAANVHYATLTRADSGVLGEVGIPDARSHRLPNSVALPPSSSADDSGVSHATGSETERREAALDRVRRCLGLPVSASWCLYPVRGIRRKNVGEFLLLTRWLPPERYGGLTLRPTTPVEARSYERWRRVAKTLAPRAVFDAAHDPDLDYATNLAASEVILSTSVAEGFGMAFLEPWLAGRGVVARRIATATDDFLEAGMWFDSLYESIPVPGSVDRLRTVREETRLAEQAAWRDVPESFRPSPTRSAGDDENDPPTGDTIDFAELLPVRQIETLERMSRDVGFEAEMRSRSAPLLDRLTGEFSTEITSRNRSVIESVYSTRRQGERLWDVYQAVLGSATGRSESDRREATGGALDAVQRVHPYFPCRTEIPPGNERTVTNRHPLLDAVLRHRRQLVPLPTDVAPRGTPFSGIRAVIFDVYGTLLISGCGEIGVAAEGVSAGNVDAADDGSKSDSREVAMADAFRAVGWEPPVTGLPTPAMLDRQIRALNDAATGAVANNTAGTGAVATTTPGTRPEVDLFEAWRRTLNDAGMTGHAAKTTDVVRLAAEYESRANPTWPMPGAADCLSELSRRGFTLGIVSNAQPFTVPLVEDLIGTGLADGSTTGGRFDLDLCIFSYRYRQAKPSPRLFDALVASLGLRGIASREALYVGNDMLNDVWAASRAGLKTVWFAGDARSCRPRADDRRCRELSPDAVITTWEQLVPMLPRE